MTSTSFRWREQQMKAHQFNNHWKVKYLGARAPGVPISLPRDAMLSGPRTELSAGAAELQLAIPKASFQGLFHTVRRIFKNGIVKAGGLMAPGLLMRRLLVSHHLADFLAEHTLDFALHCFSAGFAEMRPDQISSLADFPHHRGRGVRQGGEVRWDVVRGAERRSREVWRHWRIRGR